MDIYSKELNQIYKSQALERETLSDSEVKIAKVQADNLATICQGSAVVTDAATGKCYIFGGSLGKLMGFFKNQNEYIEEASPDEDIIYSRIHPEDLVDKRLLEYEYFKFVDIKDPQEKLSFKAVCRIRMCDATGEYLYINNSTQLLRLSPAGKIWLILCRYELSADNTPSGGIQPAIVNLEDSEITRLDFSGTRKMVLSEREKEILRLIQEGFPSKLIADKLHISVHTVNRHRQNIISKLSVSNSMEAVMAATAMRLF